MYQSISGYELLERIRALENEVSWALEEKERQFGYKLVAGQVRFHEDVERLHARLRKWLPRYVLEARPLVALTAPLVYACAIPFVLLDLFVTVYQAICFPVYGVPKVRRENCFLYDRGKLKYLNLLERFNCLYCSYANGLCAYVTEIAARTEQHWCPIKHAQRLGAPHSRYGRFLEYGDAQQYRARLEQLRHDFQDLAGPPR